MGWFALHALFWAVYLVKGIVARTNRERPTSSGRPPPRRAPFATGIVLLHSAAAFVFYLGLFRAAIDGRARPPWAVRAAAVGLHLGATALAVWAVAVFRSWRVRAEVDAGHELATAGPFALVRHPVYASMHANALAAVLTAPTPHVMFGAVLMAAVVDARARGEERLLGEAFGERYRAYASRVPTRFVPGIY